MARKLETELKEAGCEIPADEFREKVEKMKATMYPSWTADDLVCHPDEAKQFCDMIRKIRTCGQLEDYIVLRTLLNARKRTRSCTRPLQSCGVSASRLRPDSVM